MTEPILKQYAQIIPTVDLVFGHLDRTMKSSLAMADNLPVPAGILAPYLARWDRAVADLGRARTEIVKFGPELEQVCNRILTLRQAGELWQELATAQAYPLASSLDRSELGDGVAYAWGCGAVDRYWQYIGGSEETAEALAGFQDELGLALVRLADAIEKQNTELSWAMIGFFTAAVAVVAGGATLGSLLARAGANVASWPGAIIGAVVGALLSFLVSIGIFLGSWHRWQAAMTIVADQGTKELATLEANVRALEADAWPAPRAFGSASDFQEG